MFNDDVLRDQVILVTGGGSGLGKSMALRFAEVGAKLILAGRRQEVLDEAVGEIEAQGGQALAHSCDVRDFAAVEAMVAAGVERFGRLDGLVNNAAGNFLCPTEELSPGGFNAVVQIVLYGSFHCTLAAGRQMIAQGSGGSVLSITTTYATHGSAFVIPSAAAKAGVLAMTRSLAVEWARHKIRLNAIAPGPFPTEGAWSRLVPPEMEDAFGKGRIPAGRYGEHQELADLATYLMAPGAGYVTGHEVVIDGGESLMGGEFNFLTKQDPAQVAAIMRRMRPEKKKPEQES